jgi:hypothetical protein
MRKYSRQIQRMKRKALGLRVPPPENNKKPIADLLKIRIPTKKTPMAKNISIKR